MYLQKKNQHCIFNLSVLFCSKTEKHYTLCSAGPSFKAKLGLPDEFSQKMFPITPPGNGNVGLGPRDLSEFGFKVLKFFWDMSFFYFFKLKLQYFVQESEAKFTIFYLL
jgi:hypothetical protein